MGRDAIVLTSDGTGPSLSTLMPEPSAENSVVYKLTIASIFTIICLSVITILINPMTIISMALYGSPMKNPSHIFILSLCLADYTQGLSMLLAKAQQLMILTQPGKTRTIAVLSWVSSPLVILAFFASLFNILVIGVDRLLATVFPLRYKSLMTVPRSLGITLFVWTFVLLMIFIPFSLSASRVDSFEKLPILVYPNEILPLDFIIHFSTPLILASYLVISIIYGAVVIAYSRAFRRIRPKNSIKDKSRNVTKMILIIICMLFFFNGPATVLGGLPYPDPQSFPHHISLHHFLIEFSYLLMLIPTFCNNFIYAWHLQDFRTSAMKLLKGGKFSASGSSTWFRFNNVQRQMTFFIHVSGNLIYALQLSHQGCVFPRNV